MGVRNASNGTEKERREEERRRTVLHRHGIRKRRLTEALLAKTGESKANVARVATMIRLLVSLTPSRLVLAFSLLDTDDEPEDDVSWKGGKIRLF